MGDDRAFRLRSGAGGEHDLQHIAAFRLVSGERRIRVRFDRGHQVLEAQLPDNTKAIIVQLDALTPHVTPAFLEYTQARKFHVDPARVRHPRDKARVERAVSSVRDDCG